MDEELVKHIKRSKYRVSALKAIGHDVKMPKEIAEDSCIRLNHISVVLMELKDCGLVECITPQLRKGRLYRLSDKGLEMLDIVK